VGIVRPGCAGRERPGHSKNANPLMRAWHSLGPGAKMPPDHRFAKECRPLGWHSLAPPRAQPSHPTGIVVDNPEM